MKKSIIALLGAFSLAFCINTTPLMAYSATLADESISYDKAFVLDVAGNNITYLTAQAVSSNGTPAAKTFTDGNISTGAITIGTLARLTTAYATDTITISSVVGLSGAGVSVGPVTGLPGFVFIEGRDWRKGTTPTTAAASLAAAMAAKIPGLSFSPSSGVITITAPKTGTYYNSIPVSSNHSSVTVATAYLAGGQDNAVVTINGTALQHNKEWYVGTTSATAAISLMSAINANTALSPLVIASTSAVVGSTGKVFLASRATGAAKNYKLVSSIPAYLALTGAAMTGGTGSAYTTGSSLISIPAHGLNTGLPVWVNAALAPLAANATYYVSVVDVNTIKLSLVSTDAVAGLGIAITATPAPINTYTLTPSTVAGTSSLTWEVSNDALTWADAGATVVTISDYGTLPITSSWDFGNVGYRYARLVVVAPTYGALNEVVTVNGSPLSAFVRTTGDTMTAGLTLTGVNGYVHASSTITAPQFTGSGTSLTGVVLKTGSDMTGKLTVSSSTTSGFSVCQAGAFVTLPTSGYAEGCSAYQVSDHTLYISTEAVSKAASWKAIW